MEGVAEAEWEVSFGLEKPTSMEDVFATGRPRSPANSTRCVGARIAIGRAVRSAVRRIAMKNALRFAVISATIVAGLALTGASRAQAGVSISGTFPLPHGVISIGIGDPYFHVGAYVPVGYRICARDGYGYGFMYGPRWIPVQRYGAGWRVCDRPWYDDVYYRDVYYGGGYYTGRYSPRYHARVSHRYYGDSYAYRSHDGDRWNGHRDRQWSDRNERWSDRGHDRNGHRGRKRSHGHRH